MITPIELQSKTFKTGLGYEKRDVENFLNSLLSDYEIMYKENMELKDKINTLNNGLNYYKSIEKTLQKALVLAEKAAEDTKEASIKEARAIEEDAKGKAQVILADAQYELQKLHDKTLQLLRQYDLYKAQFKHLAAAQVELLDGDSFQIQMANLDTFILNPSNESDSAFSEAAAANSEEVVDDEDFEFYDLNEKEQEL
ncbi:MAG: DivIVA family protein [Anaerocolumna sp.]|jgi:cell division initiation protein|nr:DivIVA family protein [Anaerocolumna sp.]